MVFVSLWLWLISLRLLQWIRDSLRFIPVVGHVRRSLLYKRLNNISLYVCTASWYIPHNCAYMPFIRQCVLGMLPPFGRQETVLWTWCTSHYLSYCFPFFRVYMQNWNRWIKIFNFLRDSHAVLCSNCTIYRPTESAEELRFLHGTRYFWGFWW